MSMNTTPKLKNSSTGKYDLDWEGTDGAGHVADQATLLTAGLLDSNLSPKTTRTTDQPIGLDDSPSHANIDAVAVDGSEQHKITLASDVDGVVFHAIVGNYWLTVATSDIGDAIAAGRLSSPATNGDNSVRYYVAAGSSITIKLPGMAYLWATATAATNTAQVYPL